jgi:hypothetical protein
MSNIERVFQVVEFLIMIGSIMLIVGLLIVITGSSISISKNIIEHYETKNCVIQFEKTGTLCEKFLNKRYSR